MDAKGTSAVTWNKMPANIFSLSCYLAQLISQVSAHFWEHYDNQNESLVLFVFFSPHSNKLMLSDDSYLPLASLLFTSALPRPAASWTWCCITGTYGKAQCSMWSQLPFSTLLQQRMSLMSSSPLEGELSSRTGCWLKRKHALDHQLYL